MIKKPKLIIDTDPGHDDALALLLILLSKKFDVLAITTVAGNTTIKKVTRNTQAILNLINSNVPIYSGLPKPIKRKLITAVVHGESGLAGFDTSATQFELTGNAPQQIIEIVRDNFGEVSILALGPLSNIARAIQHDPKLPSAIKQIVIMGGAIDVPGNKNRVAEFNFFVDPEAADIVFRSKISKILVPLDACNQTKLELDDFNQIKNKKLRKIIQPMMKHFLAGITADEGMSSIVAYDALAAYFLLNPSAFKLQTMDIVIETLGMHTFGMSVAEKRISKIGKANVRVVTNIQENSFKKELFDILNTI